MHKCFKSDMMSQTDFESGPLRCLVCQAVTDEFLMQINRVDPKKKIESLGGFRIDANGNQDKTVVCYCFPS